LTVGVRASAAIAIVRTKSFFIIFLDVKILEIF